MPCGKLFVEQAGVVKITGAGDRGPVSYTHLYHGNISKNLYIADSELPEEKIVRNEIVYT